MMNEKIETYNLFMDRPCARTSDKRSGRVDCYNKWTKTFEVKIMSIRLFGILIVLLLLFLQVSCKKPTTEVTDTEKHGHEEHGERDDHAEEQRVQISPQEMEEFDVEVAEALPGKLHVYHSLPGEIVYDPDILVHIVPRVSGIVCEVRKK